nr:copper amine oxidase N-terminal domain-containing protein [Paenibacillus phyllosphaerae]
MLTGAGAVAASESTAVTAFLMNAVKFKFDGEEKKLDSGYSVLSYKNATYVPARFVAEQLGAKVVWDSKTQSILIDSGQASTEPAPVTKPVQPQPEVTKPVTQTSEWDKYDGEWSNADLTVKLDFVSAVKANVELKSTTKTEFNGLSYAADFSGPGGQGDATFKGESYSITLSPTSGDLLITIVNKTTRHVYTGILTGNSDLPVTESGNETGIPNPGAFTGNFSDYQGKWKRDKQTLTLSFDGSTAKLVYDNEDANGVSDFTAEVKIASTGSGATEVTIDGSKRLVQLTLNKNQVTLAVIEMTTGLYTNEVYTSKE